MAVKIFNTLSKSKEEFKPLKNGEVSFYQCGPTVYWTQHIGNLRAAVIADLINRFLSYLGYSVKYVRNYTDVGHLTSDSDIGEDKMEKGAKREGLSPKEIANKYINIFEDDLRNLNAQEPQYKPLASEYVDEMQAMIQILLEKGFAYQTGLAIYFDVSKAKDYNRLSGQIMEENVAGAGAGETHDEEKKNPADFALWFFKAGKHANALQTWQSPWGEGFPGWHIECSAMIKNLLGETIDIHMGGIEHISVHHTNEIAQSEAANGKPFVNYWIHNEHLLVDNGKMSKSEGTSYSLTEVKEKGFNPLALRYLFLQAHYRSKQNFTWEALEAAQNGFKNLQNQIRQLGKDDGEISTEYKNKFTEAISDDFNFPQGLAVIHELLKSGLSEADKLTTILDFDRVLGLKFTEASGEGIPEEVLTLAQQREEARKNKNWEEADLLRNEMFELGYDVDDTASGFAIKKK